MSLIWSSQPYLSSEVFGRPFDGQDMGRLPGQDMGVSENGAYHISPKIAS